MVTFERELLPVEPGTTQRKPVKCKAVGLFVLLAIAICGAGPLGVVAASTQDVPAELIHHPSFVFYNGQVLTADADKDFTIAEAVAVRGNRIFAVGTSEDIRRLAGPETRAIDLRGRSLTPGFIYNDGDNAVPAGDIMRDSQWSGMIQPNVGGETLDQLLATLAFLVEEHGAPGKPIFFDIQDQWAAKAFENWGISTLEEIAPDVPMIIYLDSSYGLANTAMIELALEEGFPEDHFHLDRDEDGAFTGRVGAQFNGFVGRIIRPWPDPEWFDEVAVPGAIETLAKYARHGVTVATGHMSAATMTVLNRVFHADRMAIRVYPGLDFLRQNPFPERYLKRMGNLVDFSLSDERGEMVTIVGASVGPHAGSPDAAAGLLTIEPKTNVIPALSPNTNGYNRWTAEWFTGLTQDELTPEQLKQTDYYNVMLARQHGWNVTGIHNMGSQGIRLAMQNVLAAEHQEKFYVEDLWRPHGFDHNIDWTPEVFEYYKAHPELKELVRFGVSIRNGVDQRDAKPLGIENVIEAQYGMEGLERMAPLNSLLEQDIPFHIEGSEPEDDKHNPMWYVWNAVTRLDEDGRVIAEHEALTRKAALLALTRWAARFIGAEDEMGSIEVGNLADLVVFDGNVLQVPVEGLAELRPVLTLVGGQVSFESPDL